MEEAKKALYSLSAIASGGAALYFLRDAYKAQNNISELKSINLDIVFRESNTYNYLIEKMLDINTLNNMHGINYSDVFNNIDNLPHDASVDSIAIILVNQNREYINIHNSRQDIDITGTVLSGILCLFFAYKSVKKLVK